MLDICLKVGNILLARGTKTSLRKGVRGSLWTDVIRATEEQDLHFRRSLENVNMNRDLVLHEYSTLLFGSLIILGPHLETYTSSRVKRKNYPS